MVKPKSARNIKVGDSVILKRRKLKNLTGYDISSNKVDPDIIFKNRMLNHIEEKNPLILNAFHTSDDPSKILKVIDINYNKCGFPVARVKVKSKNNNPWSEDFWQFVALEDLLKV